MKIIKSVVSVYATSFSHMREDLPQIFLFLKCLLGLGVIGISYLFCGKVGSASSVAVYFALRAWFGKWFSKIKA